jgi:hypothetical protein
MRGIAIQLLDHAEGPPLKDAERSFLRALETSPDDVAAIEETCTLLQRSSGRLGKSKKFCSIVPEARRAFSTKNKRHSQRHVWCHGHHRWLRRRAPT